MTSGTVRGSGPGSVVAGAPPVTVVGSLSPSRAGDFKTCPLLYRFRSIDRIPERPTAEQIRGTVVHAVLERLFDLPPQERTVDAAVAMVDPEWHRLDAARPVGEQLFGDDPDGARLAAWLGSARELVAGYFAVEDPRVLSPAGREELVEAVLPDGLLLRGYVDRLDVASTGELRVVDYKTGGMPREAFEARALFQMKFYALVLWRTRGVVPRELRLIYLADRDVLTYHPDAEELVRFERTVVAIWRAIERAVRTEDFRPNPSRLCDWCDHHERCPAKGGTLPPFPRDQAGVAVNPPDRRAERG
ncbi:MAG TPA: PD-(D/E)XK nuclease family protein [Mycobacteriales bacterium]